jgi:hypothetical protein
MGRQCQRGTGGERGAAAAADDDERGDHVHAARSPTAWSHSGLRDHPAPAAARHRCAPSRHADGRRGRLPSLVAHVRTTGAALVVMGACTHSQVRERVFGGMTSSMLQSVRRRSFSMRIVIPSLLALLAALPLPAGTPPPACAPRPPDERERLIRSLATVCTGFTREEQCEQADACRRAWFAEHEEAVWRLNLNPHALRTSPPS